MEHAILCTSLLRALGIPARPFSGALESYAQVSSSQGDWFGMSTTSCRCDYRARGELGSGFGEAGLRWSPI